MCACLLAFPAFLDRYGVKVMSKIRSYASLLRPTTSHKSQSSRERMAFSSRTPVKTGYDHIAASNESMSKLNEPVWKLHGNVEELPMQDFRASDAPGRRGHATHRADMEYMEEDQQKYAGNVYKLTDIV